MTFRSVLTCLAGAVAANAGTNTVPAPTVSPTMADPLPTCCWDVHAKCLACRAEQTVHDYCHRYPDTDGCPQVARGLGTGQIRLHMFQGTKCESPLDRFSNAPSNPPRDWPLQFQGAPDGRECYSPLTQWEYWNSDHAFATLADGNNDYSARVTCSNSGDRAFVEVFNNRDCDPHTDDGFHDLFKAVMLDDDDCLPVKNSKRSYKVMGCSKMRARNSIVNWLLGRWGGVWDHGSDRDHYYEQRDDDDIGRRGGKGKGKGNDP